MALYDFITYLVWLNATISCVTCHSWITCTDYVTKNDDVYDVAKCRGFPRAANTRLPKTKTFAADSGFDTRPQEGNPCQTGRNDDVHYDRNHPMAVYYPGQQVVLAHPMKNHGADTCTNIYIPDNGNFIYRGKRNGQSDPPLSEFQRNLVFDLGRSPVGQSNTNPSIYPKPGFQNAPAFCDKSKATTDNALGTYSFNVPRSLREGRYTFIWLWAFNGAQDLYSTCFEVDIVSNLRERNQRLSENGFSDTSEPCGGVTSNPRITGNCNQRQTGVTLPPQRTSPQQTPARPGVRSTPSGTGNRRTPSGTGNRRTPSGTGNRRTPSGTGNRRTPSGTGNRRTPSGTGNRRTPSGTGNRRTKESWWKDRESVVCDCRCNSSSGMGASVILIALSQFYIANRLQNY